MTFAFWFPGARVRRLHAALLVAAAFVSAGAWPALGQTPGLIPLTEMGGALYKGFPGGLYPGGSNAPPAVHLAPALQRGSEIVPRAISGEPDPNGWIVVVAVGMSNTTHEFAVFERLEDASSGRNARVVLMDTGLGGQTATAIADPNAAYWTVMQQRLAAMGLGAGQVQVAWLKEAEAQPPDDFPLHAQGLRDNLERIANNLHARFPHLKLCYLSSRIYGGYAAPGSLNPEPQAYESGFSVKWLIEDQINGDPGLDFGQGPGPARAPLLLWGPYLWANGPLPRADGLTWELADLEGDRTHPSGAGELKVAQLLSAFFSADATAAAWWPASGEMTLRVIDADRDAHVRSDVPAANFGAETRLAIQGTPIVQRAYAGFDLGTLAAPAALAKLSLRVGSGGGGTVGSVSDTSWTESGITWSTAPPVGPPLVTMPQSSRDGTIAANVTAAANASAGGSLGVALGTPAATSGNYVSREGGDPPRLVLVVPRECPGADGDGDSVPDSCDCLPSDPGASAVPTEVRTLRWDDAGTISWDPPVPFSGTATRYDAMTGDLGRVGIMTPGPADACLASGTGETRVQDTAGPPLPGEGRFVLVRARNACGSSRWETATSGSDRAVSACPPP